MRSQLVSMRGGAAVFSPWLPFPPLLDTPVGMSPATGAPPAMFMAPPPPGFTCSDSQLAASTGGTAMPLPACASLLAKRDGRGLGLPPAGGPGRAKLATSVGSPSAPLRSLLGTSAALLRVGGFWAVAGPSTSQGSRARSAKSGGHLHNASRSSNDLSFP